MSYPVNNQQCYPQQQYPMASCGAVSINILNPTVTTPNGMYQTPNMQNGIYQYPQANYYATQNNQPQMSYPMNYNNNFQTTNPLSAHSEQAPTPPAPAVSTEKTTEPAKSENKTEEKKEEELKEKIPLTDNYIMSLENYLNSQDSKVRLMGAKDVLERFKEDSTRKTDPALNALLNKALQDPNSAVRFLALTTLSSGYAAGNEQTVDILKNIQAKGEQEYGEDSLLASEILLKMSAGEKVKFKPKDTPAKTSEAK